MELIDTHAHLTDAKYDADRAEVVARAAAAGVAWIVGIGSGYGYAHNAAALDLARRHAGIRATVGLHPHDARDWSPAGAAAIRALAGDPHVVAVGECGLDYARGGGAYRREQLAAFSAQCALAVELGLPVVVHTRDAAADTLAILREHGIGARVPGVIHFFTGDGDAAAAYLDLGLFLGIPGVVTLPNAPQLAAAIPVLPLDRLVLETDSPYAAPVPRRGRRNEPAYVAHVAAKVAELRGLPAGEVAAAAAANARRLYPRLPEGVGLPAGGPG